MIQKSRFIGGLAGLLVVLMMFGTYSSVRSQTTVIGSGVNTILPGDPPGGIGGSCSAAPKVGYLDANGNVITCPPTSPPSPTGVWTVLSSSGGGTWGSITGTLSNQTDLNTALGGKAASNASTTVASKTCALGSSCTIASTNLSDSSVIVRTSDTGSVTNTMLAGSIANAKLTNTTITVNGTTCTLGSSCTPSGGATIAPPYLASGGTSYGPVYTLTPPPSSGWTWFNGSTSTATTTNGAITIFPNAALGISQIRCYMRALPASTGYTVSIAMLTNAKDIGFALSDGTKYYVLFSDAPTALHFDKWNSTNSNASSSALGINGIPGPFFARWKDAGGTRTGAVSADGVSWTTYTSESTATFLTETNFGVCQYTDQPFSAAITILSVTSSTP